MLSDFTWPLITVLALGAFHGVNPAMGWLFAVALGLQENSRRAVWSALVPLAVGHAAAVGFVVLLMTLVGRLIPLGALKIATAAILLGLGTFLFIRHRHPRFGGMRVGWRDLGIWSFLVASAHGAGLMVVPFLFGGAGGSTAHPAIFDDPVPVVAQMHEHGSDIAAAGDTGEHPDHGDAAGSVEEATDEPVIPDASGHAVHAAEALDGLPIHPATGVLATLLHSIGYLLIMGIVAVVVYERFGLRLLRTHWINLDVIWIAALVLTAILTILI